MTLFNKCNHKWKLDYEKEKNSFGGETYYIRIYICEKCGKIKKVEI